jgi:hypothetical protein
MDEFALQAMRPLARDCDEAEAIPDDSSAGRRRPAVSA